MGVFFLGNSLSRSILAHALFFLVCALVAHQRAVYFQSVPKTLWVELKKAPSTKKIHPDEVLKSRIVQTAPAQAQEQLVKDAFLGEKNQKTDFQTVSREQLIKMSIAPAQMIQKQRVKEKMETHSKVKTLSQLGIPIWLSLKEKQQAEVEKNEPQWADYSSQPQDYVKGIKESNRTILNTKEYIYYSYYQRIRERLDRAWVPILREKLMRFYQAGRQLASDMDHATKVLVILNQKGEIVRVQILSESGTKDLDDAAVKAFNQAGPFPNPPHGIMNAQGEIEIPWNFILRT